MNKCGITLQTVNVATRRGSILIVALWIVLIFTVIALSLGMRGAFEAKIARFYHERFVDRALARSGIDLGMFVIESDKDVRVDSLNDTWYNENSLKDALNVDTFDRLDIMIRDEESRININRASEKVLQALFEHVEKNKYVFQDDREDSVANILFARGDSALAGGSTLDKDYVGRPFWNLEELLLFQVLKKADLDALSDLITVFPREGDELKVNINTANAETLDILISSAVSDETSREELLAAITDYRDTSGEDGKKLYFTKKDLSAYEFLDQLGLTRDVKLVSLAVQFLRNATVDSQYFSIRAQVKDTHYAVRAVVGPVPGAAEGVIVNGSGEPTLAVLQWRES
jgi:type II secretory pathway component PulK